MKKPKPRPPESRRLKLSALVPFYLQALYFAATTPDEDVRLVADLEKNGQRDPVIVVPAKGDPGRFAILDGHRRVTAAKTLGWTEINVTIRWDLVNAEDGAIEAEFLKFNFNRRQLHPLDKARIVLRLFEIEKGRRRGRLLPREEPEARDRIGKEIGMSGRNLQRYVRLLRTPIEVQRAVKDGGLPLVMGEKVQGLPEAQQDEIAHRIAAGDNPKAAVARHIGASDGRHKKTTDAFRNFTRHLESAVLDLEGRTHQVYRKHIKDNLPLFDRVTAILASLRKEAEKP